MDQGLFAYVNSNPEKEETTFYRSMPLCHAHHSCSSNNTPWAWVGLCRWKQWGSQMPGLPVGKRPARGCRLWQHAIGNTPLPRPRWQRNNDSRRPQRRSMQRSPGLHNGRAASRSKSTWQWPSQVGYQLTKRKMDVMRMWLYSWKWDLNQHILWDCLLGDGEWFVWGWVSFLLLFGDVKNWNFPWKIIWFPLRDSMLT